MCGSCRGSVSGSTNRDHLDRILEKTEGEYKLFYVEQGEFRE